MKLLRGSVTQAWVNWEAFLGNLIRAVFRLVIGENDVTRMAEEDQAQLKYLVEKQPTIRTMIENQLKRRGKGAAAFELIVSKDNWRTLPSDFSDKAIDSMSPIFAPGGNHRSINDTFKELFHKKGRELPQISSSFVNSGDEKVFYFNYYLESQKPLKVVIKKEESLRQILQFYYGLRCAFSHRSVQMTFEQGALANFPSGNSAIKLIVEHKTGKMCESAIKTVLRSFVELHVYEKLKQIE